MKILSKKKQKKVCNAIVANTIMAFDLLDLNDSDAKRTIEYTKHLIENTMEAVLEVGGWNAMLEAKETICRYQKRIEARHLKEYDIFTEYLWHVDELPKNCIAPVPDDPSEPTTEDVQSVISSVSCYDPQIELPGEKSNASDLYDGVWKKLKKDSEEQQTNA